MIVRERTGKRTPGTIYMAALKNQCRTTPDEEARVAKHPHYAYEYASDIIKGRWRKGEKAIATNSENACLYAASVLKGRFKAGEETISSDPGGALFYARDVIEGRWEHGEDAILRGQKGHLEVYVEFLTDILRGIDIMPRNVSKRNQKSKGG